MRELLPPPTKIPFGHTDGKSVTNSYEWTTWLFNLFERFLNTVSQDPYLIHAIQVIQADYGDVVSVEEKNKDLLQFGRNELVGTGDATIQHQPAGVAHETYVSANVINTIVSTSASDGENVVVEGHTISGGNFTFVTQTVTLNGQTEVTLTTPLARSTRIYNDDSTELAGVVSVFEGTDGSSSGVPTTAADVHIQLGAGTQASDKASTTISNTDYWIVTGFYGDILEKTSASAEIHLEIRLKGKVFRTMIMKSASSSNGAVHQFKPYMIVPKNADVRLTAVADGSNTDVSGGIQGVLAKVV